MKNETEKYWIVELEPGVWLAGWRGRPYNDPGETLIKKWAQRYGSSADAETALSDACRFRTFPAARVVQVKEKDNA